MMGFKIPRHTRLLVTFYLLLRHIELNNAAIETDNERLLRLFDQFMSDPMYLIYVLDSSGSVGEINFNVEIDFVNQTTKRFPVSQSHTRIAVVTYSTPIYQPINYINNPQGKNKCSLQRDIHNITYEDGATATGPALREAYGIFPKSNMQDVTRLLILITDGNSNQGENPVDIANQMRNEGIKIISVGVGNKLNHDELLAIAGTEERVFYLDNFDDIASASNVVRGDIINKTPWELLPADNCDGLCTGGDCCDTQTSECACALESGSYGCACKPGYTWSEKHGECTLCSATAYKSVWGKQPCDACPLNSETIENPATERHHCQCIPGYKKANDICEAITCEVLQSTASVKKISTHCSNSLYEECSFACATNYKIIGGNKKRFCQSSGLWSGEPLQCSEILCDPLPNLKNGVRQCSSTKLSIGTTCHVTCGDGHVLSNGDSVQTCKRVGDDGEWGGGQSKCKPVECGILDLHKGGAHMTVTPHECWDKSMPYLSVCSIGCEDGYVLEGPKTTMCQANKAWSDEGTTKCIDKEKPTITNCPSNITKSTDRSSNTAKVTWDELIVVDNSGQPCEIGSIARDPKGKLSTLSNGDLFPIGRTEVIITTTDEAQNKEECIFHVTVIDDEDPVATSCRDIETNTTHSAINITFDEPEFEDNSNKDLVVTFNIGSGLSVKQGEKVSVSYTAEDPYGNVGYCNFTVNIKPSCSFQLAPRNGYIKYESLIGGQMYRVYCNKGYQFHEAPEDAYFCQDSNWVLAPPKNDTNATVPWPDCSGAQNGTVAVNMRASYLDDSCPDGEIDLQNFNLSLAENLDNSCKGCSVENLVVKCEPVNNAGIISNRRRRQTSQLFAYTVTWTVKLSESEQPEEALQKVADDISAAVHTGKLPYTVEGGTSLTPLGNASVGDFFIICEDGQILQNNLCVNCPVGTFYSDGSCNNCGKGFYQEQEAQLSCVACPVGSTTFSDNAKSSLDCKSPCEPGTYSETGIERCLPCPKGTYQHRGKQKECFQCPTGLTTFKTGATSRKQCQGECSPGTYSLNTLTPCTPCPFGTYQPQSRQSSCIDCPAGTYTATEGTKAKGFCQVINECLKSPCLNNGNCLDLEKGYRCICLRGFIGVNCEININDCAPGICKNNGTCVDQEDGFLCRCLDGFEGEKCEINVDDCKQNQCDSNSKCLDGVNMYTCECVAGFTGTFCEVNYDDCASAPCMNGGSCFDGTANFTCCCPPGYEGWTCANEVDECRAQPCLNKGICIDEFNSYRCLCPAGYVGLDCEIEVNECNNVTCVNGGSCKDLIADFECVCRVGFIGTYCQRKLSADFDLSFPSAASSYYAIYGDLPNLYAFTLSFWMKTSDNVNYGTPISYATTDSGGNVIDNAITLFNYQNFILDINGQRSYTGIKANDGFWHHICLTWDSIDGSWAIYLDKVLKGSGNGVASFIKGGGTFVIGQEQDSLGGTFVPNEAFVGLISQVNVFDYVLTDDERVALFISCGIYGNALAWPVIATTLQRSLKPTLSSAICRAVDPCFPSPCQNGGTCENDGSGYLCSCPIGYQGRHCEIVSAFCNNQSCANNAGCRDGASKGLCLCKPGFSGVRCENKTDMCSGQQKNCLNDGRCIIKDGREVCDCPKGWTGNYCQYDLNECLVNNGNCNHKCVNEVGSFRCDCLNGFALQPDGTTCNDISFCTHEGILHQVNETWSDGKCSDCKCVDGRPNCQRRKCPNLGCGQNERKFDFPGTCCPSCIAAPARCTVLGNGKLWTFDRRSFNCNGNCRYIMARDYVTGNFSIQLENNNYNKRAIFLDIDCVTVHIDFSGSVTISGVAVKLPYLHGNPKNVQVTRRKRTIEIVTNRGVKIFWKDKGKVIVHVPKHYQEKTEGLCGNMNNNQFDDTLTRQNFEAKNSKELVHSWKVEGYEHCQEEVQKPAIEDNFMSIDRFPFCNGKPMLVVNYARSQCEEIVRGPLSVCHSYVHPDTYYKMCMQDSCQCGYKNNCYCESLSAYVLECQRQNVKFQNYQLLKCGKNCGPNSAYDNCVPSLECQHTCYGNKKYEPTCITRQCESACHCYAGFVRHNGKCIKKENCPTQ